MLSLSQSIEGRLSTWNPTLYSIVTKYMSLMVQSQHARFCVWLANKEWTVDVSAALIRHHFSSLLVGLGIEPGVFLPLFCQSMFVSVSITIIIVIICHCFSLVISFNIVVLERTLQGTAVISYGTGIPYYLLWLCILCSQEPNLFSKMLIVHLSQMVFIVLRYVPSSQFWWEFL